MSIYDFCNLSTEEYTDCAVYDMAKETEVFRGTFREVMFEDVSDYEVLSFDLCPCDDGIMFVFNIETKEEDED